MSHLRGGGGEYIVITPKTRVYNQEMPQLLPQTNQRHLNEEAQNTVILEIFARVSISRNFKVCKN